MATNVDAVFERLNSLTALELGQLLGYIRTEWGVASPPVATRQEQAVSSPPAETLVSVYITDTGANRIQVVKAVRETLGLGLREANDATKSAAAIAEKLSSAEAAALKDALVAAGAVVELR